VKLASRFRSDDDRERDEEGFVLVEEGRLSMKRSTRLDVEPMKEEGAEGRGDGNTGRGSGSNRFLEEDRFSVRGRSVLVDNDVPVDVGAVSRGSGGVSS